MTYLFNESVSKSTRQAANKPVKLFFGNVGPGEIERDRLPLDDAREGLRGDGAFDAQVDP